MAKLTKLKIESLKPEKKPRKHWDEDGLFLTVLPSGSRSWRFRYARAGKRHVMVLGQYPELKLADARQRRNEIRALLRQGRDPRAAHTMQRLLAKLPDEKSFEAVARDWHRREAPDWKPRFAARVLRSLERDVFPDLGQLHVADITPAMILALLRGIEIRAVTTAHEIRQRIGAVLERAVDMQLIDFNPITRVRRKALMPIRHRKMPAIIELPEFCEMLRATESVFAYPATKLAIRLLALTAVRPNEACEATWREFEYLEHSVPTWRIPAERMKTGAEHTVPLARAAADVVLAIKPLTGRGHHVFGSVRNLHEPIDLDTVNNLLVRLGYQGVHCAHGFRSSFATIMTRRHPGDGEAIEAALAHGIPGVRGRYVREVFLERRRELADEWADLILAGAPDADSLLLGRRR
jgi:integrase